MVKILIVDDNDDYRKMLRSGLKKANFDVIEASDSISGEIKFYEEFPDLVIMDIFLPGRDGIQAIHSLKEEYENVKVIAISGAASTGMTNFLLDRALETGADITLKKPFKIEELLTNINNLLNNS
ncbi:MAG TPA: response regulator [Victivallales bacterium]|nr:response regulator [Victivallales bacterium]